MATATKPTAAGGARIAHLDPVVDVEHGRARGTRQTWRGLISDAGAAREANGRPGNPARAAQPGCTAPPKTTSAQPARRAHGANDARRGTSDWMLAYYSPSSQKIFWICSTIQLIVSRLSTQVPSACWNLFCASLIAVPRLRGAEEL